MKTERTMSSRKEILDRVRENKPSIESKIELTQFLVDKKEDVITSFYKNLEKNDGSYLISEDSENLHDLLEEEIENKTFVDLSGVIKSQQSFDINKPHTPKDLAHIQVLIVRGKIGVAENGAIWVEDETIENIRILPFIVERTIFVLDKSQIVPTMHHAYQALGKVKTGFGAFIAGPSKTGDIELNLVVGAHGALSHLVILH